ncbi:MAG: hypothetical protein J1E63_03635, partial [Muribaculaceae bacterium]|nr:hypothetical protein [Muribaculaceae bacterium]
MEKSLPSDVNIQNLARNLLLLIAMIFVVPFQAFGQLEHHPNRHVVVLIDIDPVGPYQSFLGDASSLPATIKRFLSKHKLYNEGDYLTIANYSMNLAETGGNNLQTFVTIPKDGRGETLAWQQPDLDRFFQGISSTWESISRGQHIAKQPAGASRGSLNSIHLFYAIEAAKATKDSIGANRLTILTISDDLHQGNDNIYGDMRAVFNIPSSQLSQASQKKIEKDANDRSAAVKSKFTLITMPKSEIIATGYRSNGVEYPYQIAVTDVKVAREPSIQSLLHLPALPELQRARGGYHLSIASPEMAEGYELEKLELMVETENGTSTYESKGGEGLDVMLSRNDVVNGNAHATLKAWVRYNDGLYNSLILNPYDEDYKGLQIEQGLRIGDEPKIYGALSVSDGWWFPFLPDNYYTTVTIYTVVITIIILIILVCITLYVLNKISTYTPDSQKITLRP